MILTVEFRFFRNVPRGVPSGINDQDVEEEMGQYIVLHPPHVPETIFFSNFSITIYISPVDDASHAECRHTLLPGFAII
jgi:hypothetical protein